MKRAGAWVFSGGLHDASTATVVRVNDGEPLMTDGPYHRRQGAPRRIHHHQGRRSRRRARMGAQAGDRAVAAGDRGAAVSGRTPTMSSEIERVFREEYGRAVAVLVRRFGDIDLAEEAVQDAFAMAVQRWTSERTSAEPGRMAHHDGAESHHRSSPPRGVARRAACPGRVAAGAR